MPFIFKFTMIVWGVTNLFYSLKYMIGMFLLKCTNFYYFLCNLIHGAKEALVLWPQHTPIKFLHSRAKYYWYPTKLETKHCYIFILTNSLIGYLASMFGWGLLWLLAYDWCLIPMLWMRLWFDWRCYWW